MKGFSMILLLVLVAQFVFSQTIKTSDGRVFGSRKQFMDACIKGGGKTANGRKGAEVDLEKYCSCFADRLLPSLTYKEIKKALARDNFTDLLMEDKNLRILMECINGSTTVDSSYSIDQYDNAKDTALIRKMSIKTCMLEFAKSNDSSSLMTPAMQEDWCDCTINKLFGKGYSIYDLAKLKDTSSYAYNEIVLPCVTHMLFKYNLRGEINVYRPTDILGPANSSRVTLVKRFRNQSEVKIGIGGVSDNFLFDGGASELIINQDIERVLLQDGVLRPTDYIVKIKFKLTNQQDVEVQFVRLRGVSIGEYIVNNVVAAIIKDATLLCGEGFLDKFRKWEVSSKDNVLILYK